MDEFAILKVICHSSDHGELCQDSFWMTSQTKAKEEEAIEGEEVIEVSGGRNDVGSFLGGNVHGG